MQSRAAASGFPCASLLTGPAGLPRVAVMKPWITIIGIGDDGLEGLSPAARAVVSGAELLVGGARHQAMVDGHPAERLTWEGGLDQALAAIENWRGRRVVVLATGDPMCYGAGATFRRRFGGADMTVIPYPGAFAFACARLLWSRPDVETLTVHGRPLELLNFHLQPGARLLVLSENGDTPARAAGLLAARGFGPSRITVLEHLGGPAERIFDGIAAAWKFPRAADLNMLAIECRAEPGARILPPVPGLPDDAFEHDGQITKREVRAVTLARLMPLPGAVLWDVGAGSGSVGIEWLRAAPRQRAEALGRSAARCLAIEPHPDRAAAIARNGAALGVPGIEVVCAGAPEALETLMPDPDVVFVGGAVSRPGVLETCWRRLGEGGRLVANAVTVEALQRLLAFRETHGGELTRLAVSRLEPVGGMNGFKPLIEVTQYVADKR